MTLAALQATDAGVKANALNASDQTATSFSTTVKLSVHRDAPGTAPVAVRPQ